MQIISNIRDLEPGFSLASLRKMPFPTEVLLCRPDYFDVIDEKNPFMKGNQGLIDKKKARAEWDGLRETFIRLGLGVHVIEPVLGLEDMVFAANQTFPGLDASNKKVALLSHMKHPTRQAEVPYYAQWFREHHYAVEEIGDPETRFEGGGDLVWHPGRGLIWGGVGPRTAKEIYKPVSLRFQVPVMLLELQGNNYHLDTAFAALNEQTVLIYPEAFTAEGLALIRKLFPVVIEANKRDALEKMACNAAAFHGRFVVLQKGASEVNEKLRAQKFEVIEIETGEFMKSGGSVYCMKMNVF